MGKLSHNQFLVVGVIVTLILSEGSVAVFAVLFTLNENSSTGPALGIVKIRDCPIFAPFNCALTVMAGFDLSINSLNRAKFIP
jgi:hypothetical protein